MALGVLNNISAIYAQNNLANTQASLSKTLQQLSSGSRINSGADDAAGLSLANGLQASSTALSQSAKNASEGVDFLQVADGALSQVTSLLNRAVTLATEASNGTLNTSQVTAADSEYQKILTEMDTINNNTEYNGIATFAKSSAFTVANGTDGVNIGNGGAGIVTVAYGTQSFTIGGTNSSVTTGSGAYKLTGGETLTTIAAKINSGFGATVASAQGNQLVLSGGAKLTPSVQPVIDLSGTGVSTLTVQGANDIIAPGATAMKYGSGPGVALSAAAWGAGGTGGTIAQLAAAINVAAGSTVATVKNDTLTITGGTNLIGGATTSDTGVPDMADTVSIPTSAAGGTAKLTVGNANDLLTVNSAALQLTVTGGTAANLSSFGIGASGNLSQLAANINSQFGSAGVKAIISGNTMSISGGTLSQASGSTVETESANTVSNQSVAIFTSDGTVSQSYNNAASDLVQTSSNALSLGGSNLTTTNGAQAALVSINAAITSVAASRGTLGANINTLTAVENVMTMQSTNTLAAENDVTATDYGQATSDMSKYQILSQTGIAALSQANQSQQLITKLLQ